jgi:hypothetical protein
MDPRTIAAFERKILPHALEMDRHHRRFDDRYLDYRRLCGPEDL